MTTLRVKLVNTEDSGTTYWHQVEVLDNLITNPSMETGSGDPWIPTGWTNASLDAGEGVQDTTNPHSGNSGFEAIGSDWSEGIGQNISWISGNYYQFGYWGRDSFSSVRFNTAASPIVPQMVLSQTVVMLNQNTTGWTHLKSVYRGIVSVLNRVLIAYGNGTASNGSYDDVYLIALPDVNLTVTPASLANSTENADEIRVDGRDTYVESPLPKPSQ
jgi:hypothetical protein